MFKITVLRPRHLTSQDGLAHFAIPLAVVLAVAGIGGYLISQSHAATASNVEICDNDAANNATANRGAYCLDDLNKGSSTVIWTAKTAQATGCFKIDSIGLVKNVKPFNKNVSNLDNFYANNEVVYLQSCGPRSGYLHPDGEGNTQVMLSSSAGKTEEWVANPDSTGGYFFINVPNTNGSTSGQIYRLMTTSNSNGSKVIVSSNVPNSETYLSKWKKATYTLTSSSSGSGSTTGSNPNPGGNNKSVSSNAVSDVVCDDNGASSSTANRGPYCLDNLNGSGKAAIWTANTASTTACFKVVTIGTVSSVKPLNNTNLENYMTQSDPVVYLEACGPKKGYLHPNGNGSTPVVVSSTGGKAEEWILVHWKTGNKAAAFVSVPNTNGSPKGAYEYLLAAMGNKNGNQIRVVEAAGTNLTSPAIVALESWKVYTTYKP